MANNIGQSFSDLSKIPDHINQALPMENVPLEDLSFINCKSSSNEDESLRVREALNQQTMIQYRQYALEKYPKEFIKQEELIAELQNQHFKNYWTNVHLEMIKHQTEQIEQRKSILLSAETQDISKLEISKMIPNIVPACLWTRKDVVEFKSNILSTHRSNCIKIQSLSTATVKVPTHKDGRCIFWEFATDYYDIGFGLLFEWNLNPTENIVVTISESSDEEYGENDEIKSKDEERKFDENSADPNVPGKNNENTVHTDELITTYRRECHMEVYCGSHEHPGIGYYILKFDNSYSVWRSKWLYYNVYHTK